MYLEINVGPLQTDFLNFQKFVWVHDKRPCFLFGEIKLLIILLFISPFVKIKTLDILENL